MAEDFLPKQNEGGQDPKNSCPRRREDEELLFRWVRVAGVVCSATQVSNKPGKKGDWKCSGDFAQV